MELKRRKEIRYARPLYPLTKIGTLAEFIQYGISERANTDGAGVPMMAGSVVQTSDATAIKLDNPNTSDNESTYRRGQHIYMVDHVNLDANNKPVSLTLRDPWGLYRTVTDPTHLWFTIGGVTGFDLVE